MTAREARRMTNKTPPEHNAVPHRHEHAAAPTSRGVACRVPCHATNAGVPQAKSGCRIAVGTAVCRAFDHGCVVLAECGGHPPVRRRRQAPHLPAWRWFNKRFADRNAVGIWHETYVIGEHETITSGMPPWGLAEAVGAVPVGPGTKTAAQRSRHNVAEMSHSV